MMATRMEAKGRFLYKGNSGLRAQLKLCQRHGLIKIKRSRTAAAYDTRSLPKGHELGEQEW
jgi:hypothetical protein